MFNIIFLLKLLLLTGCNQIEQSESLVKRLDGINIDSLICYQVNNPAIPAIAVGVFDDDTLLTFSHGVKGIDLKVPIEKDDKFNIGSCTKAVTAFLAARIIKKGLIKYSTTIGEIFSSDISINSYYHNKTLGDLLSHRAGIRAFTEEHEFKNIPKELYKPDVQNKRQLFSKWVLTLPPVVDKRKEFVYSNAGYSVAASMMEAVTDKTWEELVQEEIFDPLKIEGWFGWPHLYSPQQTKGHLNPHEYDLKSENKLVQFPDSSDYDISFLEPGGNITLSIKEFVTFVQELLKGIEGKGTLLNNKEYKDLLVSNYTYSNGWYQYLVNNQFYLGHEGSNGPFYARALICKGLNYGLVILSNSGNKETINGIQQITNDITRVLAE